MNGFIGGFYESSDIIKYNEVDISNSLSYINLLKPKKFIKTESYYDESNNPYSINHDFSSYKFDEYDYLLSMNRIKILEQKILNLESKN